MLKKYCNRTIILLLAAALTINAGCLLIEKPVCAATKSSGNYQIKPGQKYQLKSVFKVYKGPGKEYGCVRRADLKPSTKKHAVRKSKVAKLKSDTTVTCLKVQKKWMKIPSGWIKVDKKNLKPLNKRG